MLITRARSAPEQHEGGNRKRGGGSSPRVWNTDMKFIVLCSYELRHAARGDAALAEQELADAGFKPVGFERTAGGLRFGLPMAAIGEFRAPGADLLRTRLLQDLVLRFRSLRLDATFSIHIKPALEADATRQAAMR